MDQADLDVEVMRNIFKVPVLHDINSNSYKTKDLKTGELKNIPPFSSNVEASYQIVRYFQVKGYVCEMNSHMQDEDLIWTAYFTNHTETIKIEYKGPNLPIAICLAGLGKLAELEGEE